MNKLIRVIQGGKLVREIRLSALLGNYFSRIEKVHGVVEISDPNLETKLTESELAQLYAKFPYLNPNRPLPPKPSTEKVEFRKKKSDEKETVQAEETIEDLVESWSAKEIVDWLNENEISFDGRKKKNKEYLIKQITE